MRTAFHADLQEPKANIAWMAGLAGQLTTDASIALRQANARRPSGSLLPLIILAMYDHLSHRRHGYRIANG